jgi:RluA family pseudouridine synthase
MPLPFPILLEDGPLLAVLKPTGLPTQAPPGIESAETLVKAFLKEREGKEGNIYLGVPHRLDRPVSGVLLLARHVRAARKISEQFERRTVHKLYWACVEGIVDPPAGTWRDQLKKVYGHPRAEVVSADDPLGREAVLHYRTLGTTPRGVWLEVQLETGRTHQIRVQAASRGWPVVGDEMYGAHGEFGPPLDDPRMRPIALHGRSIALRHPMSREPLTITAPLPEAWLSLGIENPAAAS